MLADQLCVSDQRHQRNQRQNSLALILKLPITNDQLQIPRIHPQMLQSRKTSSNIALYDSEYSRNSQIFSAGAGYAAGNECVWPPPAPNGIQPVPNAFLLVPNGVQLVRNAFQLVQNDIQLVQNDIQLVQNTLQPVPKMDLLAILQNKDSKQSSMFSAFLPAGAAGTQLFSIAENAAQGAGFNSFLWSVIDERA